VAKKFEVNRAFVRGLVEAMGSDDDASVTLVDDPKPPDVIPTGSLDLDRALKIGGWPRGYISILHSGESLGKTSIMLAAVRECQKLGGIPVYVDMERKVDLVYAASIGVDTGRMPLVRPKSIEAGFRRLNKYANLIDKEANGAPILFVWDSLHAGETEALAEQWDFSAGAYGPQAKVYSEDIRRFLRQIDDKRIVFLASSQRRVKIDPASHGADKVGVGAASLHHATIIVRLRKAASIDTDSRTGKVVRATVVKNQMAGEGPQANLDVLNGIGVDYPGSVLYAAEAVGLAVPDKEGRKKTGWLCVVIPGGEAKLRISGMAQFAKEHPERFDALVAAVRERFGTKADAGVVVDDDAPVVEREDPDEDTSRPTLPIRGLPPSTRRKSR